MSNLDNRISNADQLLTQDVEKFCDSVVELYSNISKPILDILIYVQKLTQAIGGQVWHGSLYWCCVWILILFEEWLFVLLTETLGIFLYAVPLYFSFPTSFQA